MKMELQAKGEYKVRAKGENDGREGRDPKNPKKGRSVSYGFHKRGTNQRAFRSS